MTTTTPAVSTEHVGGALEALAQHRFHAVMVTRAQPTTPIVYVNVAFTALTGYTAEESVETLDGNYGHCHECRGPIAPGRLIAPPFAVRCTPCEMRLEAEEAMGSPHRDTQAFAVGW